MLNKRSLKLKKMRNRIAHYEPVWNHNVSIVEVHAMCHELIGAMSCEATKLLGKIDRFPSVVEKVSHLFEGTHKR